MKYIFSLIFFSIFLNVFSQSSVNVRYKNVSEEIEQLANVLDVNCLVIGLQGNLKGKKIVLKENFVSDGVTITKNILTSHVAITEDSIDVNVMAYKIAKDGVKIDIRSKNIFYYSEVYSLPINNHILMETISYSISDNNIPIFAYTTGISKKFNLNGDIVEGIDYCELRDSKILPKLWSDKFGINHYYYFTIDIEE